MKSLSALQFCLLATLAAPILSAPVPIVDATDGCAHYASCRPPSRTLNIFRNRKSDLRIPSNPRFLDHSRATQGGKFDLEILAEPVKQSPAGPVDPPAASSPEEASATTGLPAAATSTLSQLMEADAKRYGFAATKLFPKTQCHAPNSLESTFTYEFTVIKTDYTQYLIVGIVAIFLVAVLLLEVLDKIAEL
jgi:hypothetical protein